MPPRQQENWDKLKQTLVNKLHYSSSEDLIILNIGILILKFDQLWKKIFKGQRLFLKWKPFSLYVTHDMGWSRVSMTRTPQFNVWVSNGQFNKGHSLWEFLYISQRRRGAVIDYIFVPLLDSSSTVFYHYRLTREWSFTT